MLKEQDFHRLGSIVHVVAEVVLLGALAFLVFRTIIPSTGRITHGFIGPYTAATLLVQGEFGPHAYDDAWFSRRVQALVGPLTGEVFTPNLPTLALLALPFTRFRPQTARDIWIWLNLFLFLGTLGLLTMTLASSWRETQVGHPHARLAPAHGDAPATVSHQKLARQQARSSSHQKLARQQARSSRTPPWVWLLLIAFAAIFVPAAANFHLGKEYILILALYTLALLGLLSQRPWLVGLSLGVALLLKTSGLPLWLLLLAQRRWRALIWGFGTVAVGGLVSLPWVGLDTWVAYFQATRRAMADPSLTSTAFQTTASFFTHLFRFDPTWNPQPLANWPRLPPMLTLPIAIAALAVTVWVGRRISTPLFFAALVPLGVILLPVAEQYQFVLLLIPIFVVSDDLYRHPPQRGFFSPDWLLLGLGLILLIAPIPYKQAALSHGWLALLAYPRLFGGWLVWAVAIRRGIRDWGMLASFRWG